MSFLYLSFHLSSSPVSSLLSFLVHVFPASFHPFWIFSSLCLSFPFSSCMFFLCLSIRLPSYKVFFPSAFFLQVFSLSFLSSSFLPGVFSFRFLPLCLFTVILFVFHPTRCFFLPLSCLMSFLSFHSSSSTISFLPTFFLHPLHTPFPPTPFSPSLICLVVAVDAKYRVFLPPCLSCNFSLLLAHCLSLQLSSFMSFLYLSIHLSSYPVSFSPSFFIRIFLYLSIHLPTLCLSFTLSSLMSFLYLSVHLNTSFVTTNML